MGICIAIELFGDSIIVDALTKYDADTFHVREYSNGQSAPDVILYTLPGARHPMSGTNSMSLGFRKSTLPASNDTRGACNGGWLGGGLKPNCKSGEGGISGKGGEVGGEGCEGIGGGELGGEGDVGGGCKGGG